MHRLLRSWMIVAAACCSTSFVGQAHAQVLALTHFGRVTANATTPSAGMPGLFRRASRYTLLESGTAKELCAYVDGKGGAGPSSDGRLGVFQLALYSDANGKPAKLLARAGGWQIVDGDAGRWLCGEIYPVIAYLPAGSYWIGVLALARDGTVVRTYSIGSAPGSYTAMDHLGDDESIPVDRFDNGDGQFEAGTMAAYVRYYPASQLRVAGRTSIGALASLAMTPNYKRVSSFDLPTRAKVYAVSGYLDGLGALTYDGPPMGQQYRTVIYKDSNGEPGELMYEERFNTNVEQYALGRWYSSYVNAPYAFRPITFEAGRYWIGFLSSDPVGDADANDKQPCARYYYDHTGQWYSNANSFHESASTPFGTGTSKSDRLTAFISYRPASATDSIGRTDIATDPSRGLTPDVTRWADAIYSDVPSTLTGLHAYLDGKGATTGSQDVRMVLYEQKFYPDDQVGTRGVWSLVAKSDVVTIAAGMSARWVDFKVPAVALNPLSGASVRIGIQSSGPSPVVRDYGDTRTSLNNIGGTRSDTFADGPDAEYPMTVVTHIPVTLSVYATYKTP